MAETVATTAEAAQSGAEVKAGGAAKAPTKIAQGEGKAAVVAEVATVLFGALVSPAW